MKYRGVVYDVGLRFSGSGYSVEPFNPAQVEYDMRIIANQIHANAVRIEGEEISRLATAARAAHSEGLTVFFKPAARTAEHVRCEGVDLVFVAGCEYTIFSKGVFPGDSFSERAAWFGAQLSNGHMSGNLPPAVREKSVELNIILRSVAEAVRAEFGGPVTYSAGTWELVDWDIFDMVGIDYYRRGETKEEYVSGLDRYKVGKPLAIMEVGCCAYEGAADRGDGGFVLLKGTNPDGTGIFEGDIVPTRSEREQADYLGTQLDLLAAADADAVFVFVFSFPSMRHGEGPSDLDMMCFSLVKHFPAQDPRSNAMPPWAPKEAFHRVADSFRSMMQ
ncbi:hypothetical protein BDW62DRAFT_220190 [Aspergillus aurantiobrunneus]